MAGGEAVEPHVGEFREGATVTRYYWQLELDEQLARPVETSSRRSVHLRQGRSRWS